MEGHVLVSAEQVADRALDPGEALEVPHRRGVDVDPAETAEPRDHVPDPGLPLVEPPGPAAEAARHVEVEDLSNIVGHHAPLCKKAISAASSAGAPIQNPMTPATQSAAMPQRPRRA